MNQAARRKMIPPLKPNETTHQPAPILIFVFICPRLVGPASLGAWLKINGEAIYGTVPWENAGEGPKKLTKNSNQGSSFNENNHQQYTGEDIRFTTKGNVLYATALAWPGEKILIKSLAHQFNWPGLYPSEIASITMLGDGHELKWEMTKTGLSIETPKTKPGDYAYVFKIERKRPF